MRILLKDLSPATLYQMQVRSVGQSGVSAWSHVVDVLTTNDTTGPGPVTSLTLNVNGPNFVSTWVAPAVDADLVTPIRDLKDYQVTVTSGGIDKVYYTDALRFEFTSADNIAAFGTFNGTLTVSVKARDTSGNLSTPVALTVTRAAPGNVTGLTWASVDDSFVGTWSPVTVSGDIIDYEVVLLANAISKTYYTSNTRFELSFEDNKNAFGTPQATVQISVKARDSVGQTSAVAATLSASNPAPPTVTGFIGTAVYDAIELRWTPSPDNDVVKYDIYVDTDNTFAGSTLAQTVTGTTYTHPTVAYGSPVYFHIKAVDKFGTASVTAATDGPRTPKSAFGTDTTPPTAVTGFNAVSSSDATGPAATATWNRNTESDVSRYVIRYSTSASGPWEYVNVPQETSGATMTAKIRGLIPATNYYFGIAVEDFVANRTAFVNATTYPLLITGNTTQPAQVTGVASFEGFNSLTVYWTENTEADVKWGAGTYEVQIDTSGAFSGGNFRTVSTAAQMATIAGLVSGATYSIRVRARNSSGTYGPYSAVATNAIGQPADDIPTNTLSLDRVKANDIFTSQITLANDVPNGRFGQIISSDYSAGVSGFRLRYDGLDIQSGTVAARALVIQDGSNIYGADLADFEFRPDYYVGKIASGGGNTYSIQTVADAKFNSQVLRINAASGGFTYLAATDAGASTSAYTFDVDTSTTYILSYHARTISGTSQIRSEARIFNGTGGTDYPGAYVTPPAGWTRYSHEFTTAANATRGGVFFRTTATGVIEIDGIQIEKKIANLSTPSQWKPPSSTRIDGGIIRTGEIRSNSLVTAGNGEVGQPLWSINTQGNMQINDALVRGKIVVGQSGSANNANISVASWNYGATGAQWAILGDGTFDVKTGTGARVQLSGAGLTAHDGTKTTLNITSAGAATFSGTVSAADFTTTTGDFTVSPAGVLLARSGTVGGWTLGATTLTGTNSTLSSTGKLTLGTGNAVVIAEQGVGLYAGNSVFASANFRVTTGGIMNVIGATVAGTINATGGNFTGTITGGTFQGGTFMTSTSGEAQIQIGPTLSTVDDASAQAITFGSKAYLKRHPTNSALQLGNANASGLSPTVRNEWNLNTDGSINAYVMDIYTPAGGEILKIDGRGIRTGYDIFFGLTTRQMINLNNSGTYGIGLQSNTQYYRTAGGYVWFQGGIHSGTQDDPGAGGIRLMRMDSAGNLYIKGSLTVNGVNIGDPGSSTYDDTLVVHKAGAETITGVKTFTGVPVISADTPVFRISSTTATASYVKFETTGGWSTRMGSIKDVWWHAFGNDAGVQWGYDGTSLKPATDNAKSLGTGALRWSDLQSVLATIGTLNTTTLNKGGVAVLNQTEAGAIYYSASNPNLSGTIPPAVGTGAVGSATTFARGDHTHSSSGVQSLIAGTNISISGTSTSTINVIDNPIFAGTVIARGSVIARSVTASNGYVNMVPGGASNTGYVEFFSPNGTRSGYIGFSTGAPGGQDQGRLDYQANAGHFFVGSIFEGANRVYSAGNANLASTVTSETTFGIASAVGSGTTFARADHTHGTPATPVTTLAVTNNATVNASSGAVTITNSLTPTFTSVASGTGTFSGIVQLTAAATYLDLTATAGTAAAAGSGIGDKIALYAGTYGFGVQSTRLVAYVGGATEGFAVRQVSASGQKSSGTDAHTFLGNGNATHTGSLSATSGTFSTTLGVTGATTISSLSATSGQFSTTLGVTGATTLAALSATTGTFSSAVTAGTTSGAQVLELKPGSSADYTLLGLFARSSAPTQRSGYMGYPTAASTVLTLANELVNGNLNLVTNGTGTVQINGNRIYRFGQGRTNGVVETDIAFDTIMGAAGAGVGSLGAQAVFAYNIKDGAITADKLSLPAIASTIASGAGNNTGNSFFRFAYTGNSYIDPATGTQLSGLTPQNTATVITDPQAYQNYAIQIPSTVANGTVGQDGPSLASLPNGIYDITVFVRVSANSSASTAATFDVTTTAGTATITGTAAVAANALSTTGYMGYTFSVTLAGNATGIQVRTKSGNLVNVFVSHITGIPVAAASNPGVKSVFSPNIFATSAIISSVSATSLVAGTIQSDDIYLGVSGRIYAGQGKQAGRVELNGAGIYAFTTTNLLNDGSFEDNARVWYNAGNATYARSNTLARTGLWSGRITSTAAGDMNASSSTNFATKTPVTANSTYSVSAYGRSASVAGRTMRLVIRWWTSADAFISQPIGASQTLTTGGWTRCTASATAPANAAVADVIVQVQGAAAANEVFYFDDVQLELGSSPTEFTTNTNALKTTFQLANNGRFLLSSEKTTQRMELDTDGLRFYNAAGSVAQTVNLNANDGTFTLQSNTGTTSVLRLTSSALDMWNGSGINTVSLKNDGTFLFQSNTTGNRLSFANGEFAMFEGAIQRVSIKNDGTFVLGSTGAVGARVKITGTSIGMYNSSSGNDETGRVFYFDTGTATATISGFTANTTELFAGTGATRVHMSSDAAGGGFWAGADARVNAPFSVTQAGALTAKSGIIGGFTIDPTEGLFAGLVATRVQMKAGAGFWAGATARDSAPFFVTETGALTAMNATISGSITGSTIIGSTFKTSVSGQRTEISSATKDIRFYSATYAGQFASIEPYDFNYGAGVAGAGQRISGSLGERVDIGGGGVSISSTALGSVSLSSSTINIGPKTYIAGVDGFLKLGGPSLENFAFVVTSKFGTIMSDIPSFATNYIGGDARTSANSLLEIVRSAADNSLIMKNQQDSGFNAMRFYSNTGEAGLIVQTNATFVTAAPYHPASMTLKSSVSVNLASDSGIFRWYSASTEILNLGATEFTSLRQITGQNRILAKGNSGSGPFVGEANIEVQGPGTNGSRPRIGFHQPGQVAASLALENDGHFIILDQAGTGRRNVRAAGFEATGLSFTNTLSVGTTAAPNANISALISGNIGTPGTEGILKVQNINTGTTLNVLADFTNNANQNFQIRVSGTGNQGYTMVGPTTAGRLAIMVGGVEKFAFQNAGWFNWNRSGGTGLDWDIGELHFSSGWTVGGTHATIGTAYAGGSNDGIMLGNAHVPWRTVYSPAGAYIRYASDQAATNTWDVGIIGSEFFQIQRNAASLFSITTAGHVSTVGKVEGQQGFNLHAGNQAAGTPILFGYDSNAGQGLRFYITNTGNAVARISPGKAINANITGSADKAFIIDHPTPSKTDTHYLHHSCLEGPTADVYYRGETKMTFFQDPAALLDPDFPRPTAGHGAATVILPEYFEDIARLEGRTVQITPILGCDDDDCPFGYADSNLAGLGELVAPSMAATRVKNGQFVVRTTGGYNHGCASFFWEVKAIRKDVALYDAEPLKSESTVAGEGPYTYMVSQ